MFITVSNLIMNIPENLYSFLTTLRITLINNSDSINSIIIQLSQALFFAQVSLKKFLINFSLPSTLSI